MLFVHHAVKSCFNNLPQVGGTTLFNMYVRQSRSTLWVDHVIYPVCFFNIAPTLCFLDWITSAQAVEYVVHIYTADKDYAGTNADVYVKFFDKNKNLVLKETKLRPDSDDPYEKGE